MKLGLLLWLNTEFMGRVPGSGVGCFFTVEESEICLMKLSV